MDAFETSRLIEQRRKSGDSWLEFFRVPSLSVGLYVLGEGEEDTQEPHTEDEIYYVLSGRGAIRVGKEDRAVQPGSIVFVGARVEHYFHSIAEEMTVLVFFAPAEGTQARRAS